jgi:integrase
MGFIYRKQFTKPIPTGAKVVTKAGRPHARWKDRRGKTREAPLIEDGTRIVCEARTWTARYRNADGNLVNAPTECKDEKNARAKLAHLERRVEQVKANVLTADDLKAAALASTQLEDHLADYERHLTGAGVTDVYRKNVLAAARRVFADCHFTTMGDLRRGAVEQWMADRLADGMSARSRNAYLEGVNAFCNWCVRSDPARLRSNPFTAIPRANVKADPRRRRRAMTEEQLSKLLAVAAARPLADARTVRRGRRKGELCAALKPETAARLERLGRERVLIYKTLVLTGLRKGELASLTVAQLELTTDPARVQLKAADEKNREGNTLPVRSDLAADLAAWISESGLSPTDRVFTLPRDLRKILDRDLKAAGIPKRDGRGRTLDVHALRTTFGTLLSANGVAPRTAQQAMRHSDLKLTMDVYTDPKLLDMAGALDSLPALPLAPRLALPLAPVTDASRQSGSSHDNEQADVRTTDECGKTDGSALPVNEKGPLSTGDNRPQGIGLTGFEPATSWSRTKRSSQAELQPVWLTRLSYRRRADCQSKVYPAVWTPLGVWRFGHSKYENRPAGVGGAVAMLEPINQKSGMVCPSCRLPSKRNTFRFIVYGICRTDPSPISPFIPPGWAAPKSYPDTPALSCFGEE